MQCHSCIIHGSFMHDSYFFISCSLTLRLPLRYHSYHALRYFLQRSVFFYPSALGCLCSLGPWTWAGRSWIPLAWQSTRTLESCTWPISRRRANSRAEVQIIRVASSEPTWMEVKPRRRWKKSLVIVFGCWGSEKIDWFPLGAWVVSWILWSYVNYARFSTDVESLLCILYYAALLPWQRPPPIKGWPCPLKVLVSEPGMSMPYGVAVDGEANQVYWTDRKAGRIQRLTLVCHSGVKDGPTTVAGVFLVVEKLVAFCMTPVL